MRNMTLPARRRVAGSQLQPRGRDAGRARRRMWRDGAALTPGGGERTGDCRLAWRCAGGRTWCGMSTAGCGSARGPSEGLHRFGNTRAQCLNFVCARSCNDGRVSVPGISPSARATCLPRRAFNMSPSAVGARHALAADWSLRLRKLDPTLRPEILHHRHWSSRSSPMSHFPPSPRRPSPRRPSPLRPHSHGSRQFFGSMRRAASARIAGS